MSSTWTSGSVYPAFPADPSLFQDRSNFTFLDFLPECRDAGGIFSQPQYESFRTLVDRANDWLRCNPNFEVKTCESVEFKAKRDRPETEKMVYLEYGETSTRYIRALRLWIAEKNGKETSQQIGYFNLVPEVLKKGGIFSSSTFESLDDVVARFNLMIQTNPIPGRIITVESQEMKMSYSKVVDVDRSTWHESGSMQNYFLFVVRVFFELGDGIPEEIGIVNFLPDIISTGGIIGHPKYALFPTVVEKASNWCRMQQGIKVCNVQSVELKLKRGYEVDTQKMTYMESSNMYTYYVRILRVVYIKPRSYLEMSPSIERLTCKIFHPVQLTRSLFVPEFESLQETKNRVSAWVKATGVQVVSAETTAMRMYHGADASFTYNRAEHSEYWIFVIRLYINGSYHEPPLEMLPAVPRLEDQSCCLLS